MAKSRYFITDTIAVDTALGTPVHFKTWDVPQSLYDYKVPDLLKGTVNFEYTWQFGDRIDRLAFQYLGESKYWWVIAYVNNISYPLSIAPGTIINVPTDVRPILEKLGLV